MSKILQRALAKELKNGPIKIRDLEEQLILATMKALNNNLDKTAKSMGICDRTLLNKRRRLGHLIKRNKRIENPNGKRLPDDSMWTAKTYRVGKYE